MTQPAHPDKKGIFFALLAFLSWGFLPVYWKELHTVPAPEILAHRIVWSFLFVFLLVKGQKKTISFSSFRNMKALLALAGAGLFISLNWGIYIFAVNEGHIVETSMGYYINPLVSIAFGLLFLKEKLRPVQWISLVLATSGVIYLALDYGKIPWIALSLAGTFAVYGLLKKLTPHEALQGLALETFLLLPFALSFLFLPNTGTSEALFSSDMKTTLFLIFSGIVTALPLYWFALGVKRIPLSLVGFFQYIGPSIALLIAVFGYGEPFTPTHLISFSLIWSGLILYTLSLTGIMNRLK